MMETPGPFVVFFLVLAAFSGPIVVFNSSIMSGVQFQRSISLSALIISCWLHWARQQTIVFCFPGPSGTSDATKLGLRSLCAGQHQKTAVGLLLGFEITITVTTLPGGDTAFTPGLLDPCHQLSGRRVLSR